MVPFKNNIDEEVGKVLFTAGQFPGAQPLINTLVLVEVASMKASTSIIHFRT